MRGSLPRRARALVGVTLAVLTLSAQSGCSRETNLSEAESRLPGPKVDAGQTPSAQAPATAPIVRERRELMSTIYEVSVVTRDEARARAAITRALSEIARLERELSEWIPESDVSRINQGAGKEPVKVGIDTFANVRAALDAAERTGGAFDLTWAALRSFYLFQPGEKKAPDIAAVKNKKELVNYRWVELYEQRQTVRLKRPGMAIGLGGIAKGWAVDRASAILLEAGFPDHMVFAGGQVLVHGLRGDRKWRVGIQHPRMPGYIGFIEITNASVATAGDYEHSFTAEDGTHWHHIIDPETALPAKRSTSVTLIAPSGLIADALDTGCFVMGPKRCLEMLAVYPTPVEAVIIDDQLRMFTSQGTREKLVMRMPIDAEGRLPAR